MEIDPTIIELAVPRGMLFLYDHSAKHIEIPTYQPQETIAFSKTAISIAMISDLDGDATITVTKSDEIIAKNLSELFSGKLNLENEKLNICLIADEPISQTNTNKRNVTVKVYGDKMIFPTSVTIYIDDE